MKKFHPYFFIVQFFMYTISGSAATITSVGTGNWNVGSSWVGGVVPASTDDVVIANNSTITLTANASCASLTINGGGNNSTLDLGGFTLNITNGITINAPTANTIEKRIYVDNGTLNASSITMATTGGATRDCWIRISTGTVTISGNITMNGAFDRNHIDFTSNGTLFVAGDVTGGGYTASGTGTVNYNGTTQTCGGSYSYDNVIFSNSGTKTLGGVTTAINYTIQTGVTSNVSGNLTVTGDFTANANASATITGTLSITGNLLENAGSSVTSTGALTVTGNTTINNGATLDPSNSNATFRGNITINGTGDFIQGTSLVTLGGTTGTQTLFNASGTETFNKLSINNTSSSNPAIILNNTNLLVTNDYDHSNGFLDLNGNNLTATGATSGNQTFTWNGGGVISSVSGSIIDISQGSSVLTMAISGFTIGNSSVGITTNISSDNSTWVNSTFYGSTNFTKTGASSHTFGGGNSFYGSCSFVTTASAGRWRMGDNGSGTAGDDIYTNARFEHNGTSNYIVGCNNNTHYYGTTVFKSTSSGGVYIGRQNGTTGSYTHRFHGPVEFNVEYSGNVGVADATTSYNQTVIFESTIQVNSTSTSTGDIYFGNSAASTITITNTGQFIAGAISGRTSTYFRNITQTGNLTQAYTTSGSGARLYCGNNSPVLPCSFDGPCVFNVDTLDITRSTFNGNVTLSSTQSFTVAYSNFNGATNTFNKYGSNSNACTGSNTFATGTSTTIQNNGTGYWRWANSSADDFNGDVTFIQTGSGILDPVYTANSTFAGNISTVGTTIAIAFGVGGGRVTIDGNGSQQFNGASAQKPTVRRMTMNTSSGGTLTLNVPVDINNNLTMTSGIINTTTTNILNLNAAATTTVGNASSYINGPMQYAMASGAAGYSTLNFPIGKSADWRPASLQVSHTVATSYTYRAEVFNASAEALGWTKPATVDTVSYVHYWDIDRYLTSTMVNTPSTNLRTGAADRPIITLYFDTNDGVKDGANLTICKNTSGAPTTWIDIGGSGAPAYSAGANLSGSVTSTSSPTVFNSFSRFTLGSKLAGWNPLPVELLSFTASPNRNKVDLKWTTASERNNNYFTIEKTKDGQTFEFVAKVNGAGNSTSVLNYSATDTQPFEGLSYYRLQQTDFDGKKSYSNLVAVEFKNDTPFDINIYPNPNDGNTIQIELNNNNSTDNILIQIMNITGNTIYTENTVASKNINIYLKEKLAAGTYLISTQSGDYKTVKRIVIKN